MSRQIAPETATPPIVQYYNVGARTSNLTLDFTAPTLIRAGTNYGPNTVGYSWTLRANNGVFIFPATASNLSINVFEQTYTTVSQHDNSSSEDPSYIDTMGIYIYIPNSLV